MHLCSCPCEAHVHFNVCLSASVASVHLCLDAWETHMWGSHMRHLCAFGWLQRRQMGIHYFD